MTPDCELLRRYAEDRSEEAFADLVGRHIDLVYSAALRQVNGDAYLAQDIAQIVFSDLARKAAHLSSRKDLAGWLYTSAHFAATKAVRTESRRRTREQEARTMHDLLQAPNPEPGWESLKPVLDQAMHDLEEADREAVLLRYFQNNAHAAIADKLGINEDAARMRVERALEKLRKHLFRRGIATTTAAFSIVVSANAVQAAPVGLALSISAAAALAGTTFATTTTVTATKAIAMTTLQKTFVTITVAALAGAGIHEAHQNSKLRNQVQALQQQQATNGQQLQQLQDERDDAVAQLTAARNENERLKSNAAASQKLRERESGKADSMPPSPIAPAVATPKSDNNELPKDSWMDAGFATPEDALKTRGWAVSNGSRERFKESLFVTDGARKILEDMFVKMAEASKDPNRARYLQDILENKLGVEDAILMPLMALNEKNGFAGYRILSQQSPSDDERIIEVETEMASAPSQQDTLKFRRVGNEWKVVIDEDFVKSAR